ncbi:hypothetical protein K437DRAFT_269937 [Tilletiaria anomala UBC 951]|uniref:Mmc1 C-terminal domain-containing protein n=1 Tax=Tilletiaria anomala (strain ATCC 24038 / CBS 436.72 / UBC 951) TaxID=1037660 RepID=A0A066VJV2_TILAU|nr:uncharacterized protein K437DRAFT_269937 [Tilletiaria anomala UBC 951]KDN40603.1 hypothetical protein K437DRAFT_269937 [Tilletiaria anomala UBC 951]
MPSATPFHSSLPAKPVFSTLSPAASSLASSQIKPPESASAIFGVPKMPSKETVASISSLPPNFRARNLLQQTARIFSVTSAPSPSLHFFSTTGESGPDPTISSSSANCALATAKLFSPGESAHWVSRLEKAEQRLREMDDTQAAARPAKRRRIAIVGASTAGTADLFTALLDEPIEQLQLGGQREPDSTDTPQRMAMNYGEKVTLFTSEGSPMLPPDTEADDSKMESITLPTLSWLRNANVEILRVLDPSPSQDLLDTLYATDAIFFFADTYGLAMTSQLRRESINPGRAPFDARKTSSSAAASSTTTTTLSLISYFASKPGTRLIINNLGSNSNSGGGAQSAATSSTASISAVLEGAIGSAAFQRLTQQCADTSSRTRRESIDALNSVPPFFAISTPMALRANSALRQALAAGHASERERSGNPWDTFATLYNASGLGSIKELITHPLLSLSVSGIARSSFDSSVPSDNSAADAAQSALQAALFTAQHARDEVRSAIAEAYEEVRTAEGAATMLEREAQAQMAELAERILGESNAAAPVMWQEIEDGKGEGHKRGLHGGTNVGVRRRAGDRSSQPSGVLADSQGRIEHILSRRLQWWKMPVKVDDIRAELEGAVQGSFAKDAEVQLTFEAGRLLSSAAEQEHKTTQVLNSLVSRQHAVAVGPANDFTGTIGQGSGHARSSNFDSAILRNELSNHSLAKASHLLSVDSLSHPISRRRQQLLAPGGPIDLLALRGQTSVFKAYAWTCASTLVATYGVVLGPLLEGQLPAILQILTLQPSTGASLVALTTAFAAFRLQGSWGKAKKRFWRDWDSLTRLLDYDLEDNLRYILTERIFAQPMVASRGLRHLADKRKLALDSALRTSEALEQDAQESGLYPRPSSATDKSI